MENTNKYILQWRDLMLNAAKALEGKRFEEYESLISQADQAYELYKQDSALTYECTNFGMSNHIIENALPSLFKKKPKAVKEIITLIKEDKNLHTQFNFFNALSKCKNTLDVTSFIKESLELMKKDLNVKTINESNKKLAHIITKYDIKPSKALTENELNFYSSCDFLFKHKRNLSNLVEINENLNIISDFTKQNLITETKEKNDFFSLIENFEKKYNNLLNEEEKSFVKEIMDWKKPNALQNKEKLFNNIKEDCLNLISHLSENASDDEVEGLNAIKEQLNNKVFCEETLVTDIARLLEIRDVLKS